VTKVLGESLANSLAAETNHRQTGSSSNRAYGCRSVKQAAKHFCKQRYARSIWRRFGDDISLCTSHTLVLLLVLAISTTAFAAACGLTRPLRVFTRVIERERTD